MTLRDIKDQLAEDQGFKSWEDWREQSSEIAGHRHIPEAWHDRVAEINGYMRLNEVIGKIEEEILYAEQSEENRLFGKNDANARKLNRAYIAGLRKSLNLTRSLFL